MIYKYLYNSTISLPPMLLTPMPNSVMLELTFIPLTFVVLLVAAYIDLKTREIPDWLSYGFLFAALGIRIIYSSEEGIGVLLGGLLGLLASFAVASLFYFTDQWGGGDSKLLIGLGTVIGVDLPLQASSLNLFWFFLAVLFLGAAYGLVWMCILAWNHPQIFREQWTLSWKHSRKWQWSAGISTLLLVALSLRYPFFWPMAIFPPLVLVLFEFVTAVEEGCFYKEQSPRDLVEGDWLAEEVVVREKKIVPAKTLEKKDILLLKSLEAEKRLRKVRIKEGIPFTPAFILGYAALLAGSWWVEWLVAAVFG